MALCSRVAEVPSHVAAAAAPRAPLPVVHAPPSHVRLVLAVPHAAAAPDAVPPASAQAAEQQEAQFETLEVMAAVFIGMHQILNSMPRGVVVILCLKPMVFMGLRSIIL